MDPSINLQWATLDDIPAMEQVGDGLFDYPIKPSRAREFIQDPRHHLVLAYKESQLIAMASGFHYVHPDKEPTFFLNEVGVVENYQNQGIGRCLVRYLVDFARSIACAEIWVATEKSNTAARKAYIAAGGQEDEESAIVISFPLQGTKVAHD